MVFTVRFILGLFLALQTLSNGYHEARADVPGKDITLPANFQRSNQNDSNNEVEITLGKPTAKSKNDNEEKTTRNDVETTVLSTTVAPTTTLVPTTKAYRGSTKYSTTIDQTTVKGNRNEDPSKRILQKDLVKEDVNKDDSKKNDSKNLIKDDLKREDLKHVDSTLEVTKKVPEKVVTEGGVNKAEQRETKETSQENVKKLNPEASKKPNQEASEKPNQEAAKQPDQEEVNKVGPKQKDTKEEPKQETTTKETTKETPRARSLDIDIEKYVSADFHNKNNVYTVPTSQETKRFLQNYEQPTTKFDYSFTDFNQELTTPKSEFFDSKYRQVEEGVHQNLDSIDEALKSSEESSEEKELTLQDFLSKTKNDSKANLDYLEYKNLKTNDTSGRSSLKKDVTVEKGKKLHFNSSRNDTTITDESNLIPIIESETLVPVDQVEKFPEENVGDPGLKDVEDGLKTDTDSSERYENFGEKVSKESGKKFSKHPSRDNANETLDSLVHNKIESGSSTKPEETTRSSKPASNTSRSPFDTSRTTSTNVSRSPSRQTTSSRSSTSSIPTTLTSSRFSTLTSSSSPELLRLSTLPTLPRRYMSRTTLKSKLEQNVQENQVISVMVPAPTTMGAVINTDSTTSWYQVTDFDASTIIPTVEGSKENGFGESRTDYSNQDSTVPAGTTEELEMSTVEESTHSTEETLKKLLSTEETSKKLLSINGHSPMSLQKGEIPSTVSSTAGVNQSTSGVPDISASNVSEKSTIFSLEDSTSSRSDKSTSSAPEKFSSSAFEESTLRSSEKLTSGASEETTSSASEKSTPSASEKSTQDDAKISPHGPFERSPYAETLTPRPQSTEGTSSIGTKLITTGLPTIPSYNFKTNLEITTTQSSVKVAGSTVDSLSGSHHTLSESHDELSGSPSLEPTVGNSKLREDTTEHIEVTTKYTEGFTKHSEENTQPIEGATEHSEGTTKHIEGSPKHNEEKIQHTGGSSKHSENNNKHIEEVTKHTEEVTKHTEEVTKHTEGITNHTEGIIKSAGDTTEHPRESTTTKSEENTASTGRDKDEAIHKPEISSSSSKEDVIRFTSPKPKVYVSSSRPSDENDLLKKQEFSTYEPPIHGIHKDLQKTEQLPDENHKDLLENNFKDLPGDSHQEGELQGGGQKVPLGVDHKDQRVDHKDQRVDHKDRRVDHKDQEVDHKDQRSDQKVSQGVDHKESSGTHSEGNPVESEGNHKELEGSDHKGHPEDNHKGSNNDHRSSQHEHTPEEESQNHEDTKDHPSQNHEDTKDHPKTPQEEGKEPNLQEIPIMVNDTLRSNSTSGDNEVIEYLTPNVFYPTEATANVFFNGSSEEPSSGGKKFEHVAHGMGVEEYDVTTLDGLEQPFDDASEGSEEGGNGTVIAIVISCVGALCLILLVGLLIVMRKRQKRFNYPQMCKPVDLDSYNMDNVSVYNSVRRKAAMRASKRSYGNPAFDDPTCPSHPLNFQALAKFTNEEEIKGEFEDIPQVTARANELPEGCDGKNRYANVIPLPETRVFLKEIEGVPNSDYINANYVTGPKSTKGYYIACQAPMQNTVDDFWRMIWEQESRVILMLTLLFESSSEKCADYLPPSEVLDCHRLFGDFQVTLKKREVKDKYIISSLQLKNMVSNSWREVTHLWYLDWPEKGVPTEANSMIAFLIEARSFMKVTHTNPMNENENVNPKTKGNPVVVHCSPGTGRTGTVIACDIAIREFELTRQVDIPRIVYKIRRDRASSVQTKEQYTFIYKVITLYATKLTGGAMDSL